MSAIFRHLSNLNFEKGLKIFYASNFIDFGTSVMLTGGNDNNALKFFGIVFMPVALPFCCYGTYQIYKEESDHKPPLGLMPMVLPIQTLSLIFF